MTLFSHFLETYIHIGLAVVGTLDRQLNSLLIAVGVVEWTGSWRVMYTVFQTASSVCNLMSNWDKLTVSGTIGGAACSRPDRDSLVIEIETASTRGVVPNGLAFAKMHAQTSACLAMYHMG